MGEEGEVRRIVQNQIEQLVDIIQHMHTMPERVRHEILTYIGYTDTHYVSCFSVGKEIYIRLFHRHAPQTYVMWDFRHTVILVKNREKAWEGVLQDMRDAVPLRLFQMVEVAWLYAVVTEEQKKYPSGEWIFPYAEKQVP